MGLGGFLVYVPSSLQVSVPYFLPTALGMVLLPIVLDEQVIASLADYVALNPQANQLNIDLKNLSCDWSRRNDLSL